MQFEKTPAPRNAGLMQAGSTAAKLPVANLVGTDLVETGLVEAESSETGVKKLRRKQADAVMKTISAAGGESLAAVAHDARNMVVALWLYCDLLQEPGVLAAPFVHYGSELRLVAAASLHLMEKLTAIEGSGTLGAGEAAAAGRNGTRLPSAAKTAAKTDCRQAAHLSIKDAAGKDPSPEKPRGPVRPQRDQSAGKEPGSSESSRNELSGNEPGRNEPGNNEPGSNEPGSNEPGSNEPARNESARPRSWDAIPAVPIDDLAEELLANRNLLAALAGPSVAVTLNIEGCARPVWLTSEDLTRVLVNMVKNASEAMPAGGRIQLGLRERTAGEASGQAARQIAGQRAETQKLSADSDERMELLAAAPWLILSVEDNGPGIAGDEPEAIFRSGYTTRGRGGTENCSWPAAHRGLGLSITRSIVQAAGGRIHVANRVPAGARFEVELPVRQR